MVITEAGIWDFGNNVLAQAGLVGLLVLVFVGGAGFFIWQLWKRNKELTEKLTDRVDTDELEKRHDELVGLLKKVRFAYSGDGELMKKLNEILEIERALHEVHLGTGARDDEGRLKWWGAARLEEVLTGTISAYEERLEALQDVRLQEARGAGERIDQLQEKRVTEAHQMVREMITIMKDVKSTVGAMLKAVEDVRDLLIKGARG